MAPRRQLRAGLRLYHRPPGSSAPVTSTAKYRCRCLRGGGTTQPSDPENRWRSAAVQQIFAARACTPATPPSASAGALAPPPHPAGTGANARTHSGLRQSGAQTTLSRCGLLAACFCSLPLWRTALRSSRFPPPESGALIQSLPVGGTGYAHPTPATPTGPRSGTSAVARGTTEARRRRTGRDPLCRRESPLTRSA